MHCEILSIASSCFVKYAYMRERESKTENERERVKVGTIYEHWPGPLWAVSLHGSCVTKGGAQENGKE